MVFYVFQEWISESVDKEVRCCLLAFPCMPHTYFPPHSKPCTLGQGGGAGEALTRLRSESRGDRFGWAVGQGPGGRSSVCRGVIAEGGGAPAAVGVFDVPAAVAAGPAAFL